MLEDLKKIANTTKESLASLRSSDEIEKLYFVVLGRKGELTRLLRKIATLTTEEKKTVGSQVNVVKKELEELFATKKKEHGESIGESAGSSFDVTLPGIAQKAGSLHPVSILKYQIWDIFSQMGFAIVETPEVETDYFNFQVLNMSPEHPARDMHDTFYLEGGQLLRTHATSFQGRYMKEHEPPFRAISTGKCFRRDSDMTHTPMFHQFDGIMVGEGVSMSELKGTLITVMSKLLEHEVDVRFRISYFPFVEPGAEFDVSCTLCGGEGCKICKYTGWLEMGGCGMIHPHVLKEVGIDAKKFQGYAFGFGIERPFMIKHRINDLRYFFENDLRFLEQF